MSLDGKIDGEDKVSYTSFFVTMQDTETSTLIMSLNQD